MTRNRVSLTIVALTAALTVGAVLAPVGAGATQGQPLIAGSFNDATFPTTLQNTQPGDIGLIVEGDAYGAEAIADADGGTALYGLSGADTGIGVEGDVFGSGSGVYGHALRAGVGVNGLSTRGVGVLAQSTNRGTALKVVGKASFSNSGTVTIAAGATSSTVQLAGVTAASLVLATAQQATAVSVKAAVPAAGAFSIQLTGPAPTGGLTVAYFVLN